MEQAETEQQASALSRQRSLILLVLYFALEWGFVLFARPLGDNPLATEVFNLTVGAIFQIGIPLFVLVAVFKESPKRWGLTFSGSRQKLGRVLIVSGALLFGMNSSGVVEVISQGRAKELALWSLWWAASAFSQEVRYRGIVQSELSTFLPDRAANVAQALLFVFSPIHLAAIRQFVAGPSADMALFFLMTGVLGIVAGFFRARSGSLFASTLFHFCGGFYWNPLWSVRAL